jgi:hypothetical protein
MRRYSKLGLLVALALLVAATAATSAQAVRFTPNNTAVFGEAQNPTLTYGVATVVCATGEVSGTTGTNSAVIEDALVNFFEPCTVAGILPATVACPPGTEAGSPVDLIAEQDVAPGGLGTVALEDTFECVVTVEGTCEITVVGPQDTQPGNLELDEGQDEVTADVDVDASREGDELCGPEEGTGNFTAVYETTPTNLEIINP